MRFLTKTLLLGLALSAPLGAAPAVAAPTAGVEGKTLFVRGGPDADSVGLVAPASSPDRVRLDLDGDGLPEVDIPRHHLERIVVDGAGGDDSVRVEAPRRLEPVVFDGGEGFDALTLEGTSSSEDFRLSRAEERVRLDRGHLRLSAGGVERVDVAGRGGRDDFDVADLTGTELEESHVDVGDGEDDRVSVDGSDEQEQISVLGFAQTVVVIGAPVFVQIDNPDPEDELTVDGRGNDDLVSSSTAALTQTLRGGAATDVLLGGPGDDVLEGGDDFDDVAGRAGDDTARLGDSPDRFTWNPGDGDDVVEGGTGHDSMSFNGTDAPEVVELSADGRRLRVTRDIDSTMTDLGSVEEINHSPRGGADTLRVEHLSRTPVDLVHANMGAGFPTGDGAADVIEVSGTPRADSIAVTGVGRAVDVAGLSALVELTLLDPADTLALHTGGGNDSVDSSGLAPGIVGLVVD
jgi:Ca2+-binding RTX toxin-like protein